ncbi:MAG: hypothetical protein ACT4O5_13585 [Gammaproteobacteria bacterium]
MRTACFVLSTMILATASAAHDRDRDPPVRIRIQAPDAGHFQGLTTSTGWGLVVRIEAPDSVAIVETAEPRDTPQSRREAIVLTDPDGCLDMRHFPISNAGQPYHDCGGPDETFLEFTTERFDSFDLADSNTGNFEVRARLIDDAFAPGVLLNRPFLRNTAGNIVAVPRPQTGGALLDGYGFGPDDDLPGLVILSDLGAARVFDENFDRGTATVRNLAGFVNGVAQELLTRRGGSALTAWVHVPAAMFEPIALFDLDVDAAGVDYLRRLESGPVQSFTFSSPPANDDAVLAEISSSYAPYLIDVRVVIVEGVAPTFIRDENGDGRFTASDLKRMGFTVISNEARLRQVLDLDVLVTETITGRTCPPQSLIYKDLDGNGRDGAIPCQGSGGAARIRGVPQ